MDGRGEASVTGLPLSEAERLENARRRMAAEQREARRRAAAPHGDYRRVFSPAELLAARKRERAQFGE